MSNALTHSGISMCLFLWLHCAMVWEPRLESACWFFTLCKSPDVLYFCNFVSLQHDRMGQKGKSRAMGKSAGFLIKKKTRKDTNCIPRPWGSATSCQEASGAAAGGSQKKKNKTTKHLLFPCCLPDLSCSASICPCSRWWGFLRPFSQGCLLCWLCKQSRKCLSWVLCCWAAGQTCSQISLPAPGKIPNPNSGRLHGARLSRLGVHKAEALPCCMLE